MYPLQDVNPVSVEGVRALLFRWRWRAHRRLSTMRGMARVLVFWKEIKGILSAVVAMVMEMVMEMVIRDGDE